MGLHLVDGGKEQILRCDDLIRIHVRVKFKYVSHGKGSSLWIVKIRKLYCVTAPVRYLLKCPKSGSVFLRCLFGIRFGQKNVDFVDPVFFHGIGHQTDPVLCNGLLADLGKMVQKSDDNPADGVVIL